MQLSNPEIETGMEFTRLEPRRRDEQLSPTTSVDLLEVHYRTKPNVVLKKNLTHDTLIQHFKVSLRNARSLCTFPRNLTMAGGRSGNAFFSSSPANVVSMNYIYL